MEPLLFSMFSVQFEHALLVVVLAGLGCHYIFKRYEPHDPLSHLCLLVITPITLSPLLIEHFNGFVISVSITIAVYLSTLLLSTAAYHLSPFHPLANYPGPVACKLSKGWITSIATTGKQHIYYKALHDKYGDVVRIGPNELSIRDAAAVVPMMGFSGLPKGPIWDGRLYGQKVRGVIGIRNMREHARRRRPWNRGFSTAALKGYEVMMYRRVSQLVDVLAKQDGAIDLAQWISYFAFDFMSDMAFGGGSDMLANGGDTDGLWHILENGQPTALVLGHLPWLASYHAHLPFVGRDLKLFRAFAAQRAGIRYTQGSPYKDLFHHLIDEDGVQKDPPSRAEVISDGGLAIIAGSDTTAKVLSNLFWCLLCQPAAYARLQAEVDALSLNDLQNTARHAQMPYLNAVINEVLRLFPPVLSGSQRAPARDSRGKSIGPYIVPEGTSVFVHFYSIHRDPRYFSPAPEAFLPNRWLSTPADDSVTDHAAESQHSLPDVDPSPAHSSDTTPTTTKTKTTTKTTTAGPHEYEHAHDTRAFVPFSFGPSMCVGKTLAYQEMRAVVCMLMWQFEMRFADGFVPSDWEDGLRDYFVMQSGRLPIVLTSRQPR